MFFFFQAEDGIRDCLLSRGLGDVYKRQDYKGIEKDMITDSRIQVVAEGDGEVVFADATKIQVKYERTEEEILASFAPEVTTYELPPVG